jgi:hypothetical protein
MTSQRNKERSFVERCQRWICSQLIGTMFFSVYFMIPEHERRILVKLAVCIVAMALYTTYVYLPPYFVKILAYFTAPSELEGVGN